jgi:hypothetical protein
MSRISTSSLAVALVAAVLAAPPADAQNTVPAPYEDGIVHANASWLLAECRSDDPLRVARCDGFIQAIAAMIDSREFHRGKDRTVCITWRDAAGLRSAVLDQMKPSRTPASQAVAQTLSEAFRCAAPR